MATEMEETQADTRSIGEKLKRCKEKSRGGCGERWGSSGQESLGGRRGLSLLLQMPPPNAVSLSQEDGSTALPDDNAVCANFN